METSVQTKVTQSPVASPDGAHVACVNRGNVEIRDSSTLHLVNSISTSAKSSVIIRWSPLNNDEKNYSRILVADEDTTRVWELDGMVLIGVIGNGSGGMGKIVNAEFGRTKDEVLTFSDFGSKVMVWSLTTSRCVEIRDPKFTTKGFDFRPGNGMFALLSRPGPQDVLTIHAPHSYKVIKTATLPSTDAQGLKWSPDGKWLMLWDTSSVGVRVFIYTADGHPYRIYNGDDGSESIGLGVKCIEWSPKGDYLAIGSYNRRVTLLSTRTFSPIMFLDHTATIQIAKGASVWQEQFTGPSERSYATIPQPYSPPTASPSSSDPTPKFGLSVIAFNSHGTMVATRDDSAPTTVWLWDLVKLSASAVIVQHSPVRQLLWHPIHSSLLLMHCGQDEAVLHLWNVEDGKPSVATVPFQKRSGKLNVNWLHTKAERKTALLLSDAMTAMTVWPDGKDLIFSLSGDGEDADESMDSLYEALTGRSPRKLENTELLVSDVPDHTTEIIEDTFVGRGQLGFVN